MLTVSLGEVTEIKSVHRGLETSLSKSERSAESRGFFPGTPVSSHRES